MRPQGSFRLRPVVAHLVTGGVCAVALATNPPDRTAFEINNASMAHHNGLAWLLATTPEEGLRDGSEALRLARQSLARARSGRPYAETLNTLAAAYAELGCYEEAVEAAGEALKQARTAGDRALADRIEARVHLYRQHGPNHDGGR